MGKNRTDTEQTALPLRESTATLERPPAIHLTVTEDRSHEQTQDLLRQALRDRYPNAGPEWDGGPWLREVYDDRLIYEYDGRDWQSNYTIDAAGNVTLADPVEVEIQYVPVQASASAAFDISIEGDVHQLREGSITERGVAEIKLIQPGWGSSGFYSREVLERDGPKIWGPGTLMLWDHPTESEEQDRPEGSLRNVAAVIQSVPEMREGSEGLGLYADARVFSEFAQPLDELKDFIGVSIRADGRAHTGEAEGRQGPIIDELSRGWTVDFVTMPGAGGAVTSLFESVKRKGGAKVTTEPTKTTEPVEPKTTEPVTPKENERTDREARLEERLAIRDAKDVVEELLEAKGNVPTATAKRLAESLPLRVTLTDSGELDKPAFAAFAAKAIDDELAYVSDVAGLGRVHGLGESTVADPKLEERVKESTDVVQKNLAKLGITEKAAELAVS